MRDRIRRTVLYVGLAAALPLIAARGAAACQVSRIRVALMLDFTTSSSTYHTPQVTLSNIQRLVATLTECGNFEFAVVPITDRSGDVVIRLAMPARPQVPRKEPPAENPFARRVQERDYRLATAEYERQAKAWDDAAAPDLTQFYKRVENVLSTKRVGRTDVFSALQRVRTYFEEDLAFANRQSRRLLIAVSDMEDNTGRPFDGLPTNVTVCVVNGMGHAGVLRPVRPFAFDSIDAVLDFVNMWRVS